MRKSGTSATLPLFLQVSNTFPAFIADSEGLIITGNKLFKRVFGLNDGSCMHVKNIFTDNSFLAFTKNIVAIGDLLPAITIHSLINDNAISWEIAVFEKGLFICTGAIKQEVNDDMPVCQNPFSVFFDNSPALMWATDTDGRIQMMNKRYKEHTGFTDAYLGRFIGDVFPAEMASQFKKNDDIVLQTNKLLEIEEVSVDKAGIKRNYIAFKFPLQTAQQGTLVAGCSIEITEVLEKTKQLHFQSHLLDSIEQAVYILDQDTKVIYWSRHAEKMFGWTKAQIFQKEIAVLTPTGTLDENMLKQLQSGQSWHGEMELKRKDGSLIQVHVTKSPVLDKEKNITAFIGISKDMSEHKTVHKKLVKQNNQFRQIARLQSHAVRRPLANMLGLIDLIQYYSDKNEQEEVLYMIGMLKQSSEDLDDIIRRIVLKAGVYFDPELRIA